MLRHHHLPWCIARHRSTVPLPCTTVRLLATAVTTIAIGIATAITTATDPAPIRACAARVCTSPGLPGLFVGVSVASSNEDSCFCSDNR